MAYWSRYVARTAVVLVLALVGWPSATWADPDMPVPFAAIQEKLAGVRISAGPDASKLTRSPWGPDLYRSTVDSVVLVLVYVPNTNALGQYVRRGWRSGLLVSA